MQRNLCFDVVVFMHTAAVCPPVGPRGSKVSVASAIEKDEDEPR